MLNQIMFWQIYINITDKITTFVLNKLNYNFYHTLAPLEEESQEEFNYCGTKLKNFNEFEL